MTDQQAPSTANADRSNESEPASKVPSFDGGARTTPTAPEDMNSRIRRAWAAARGMHRR